MRDLEGFFLLVFSLLLRVSVPLWFSSAGVC